MTDQPRDSLESPVPALYHEARRHWDEGERSLRDALLEEIRKPEDLRLSLRHEGGRRWVLAVAGADQMGLLSIISGLLAARNIDISRADVYTLPAEPPPAPPRPRAFRNRPASSRRRPPAPKPLRKIMDVFHLTTPPEYSGLRNGFCEELRELVCEAARGSGEAVRQKIIDRISSTLHAIRRSREPLLPVTIRFDNDAYEDMTLVHILSVDTVGFLFAFANALTMMKVNIEHAAVRTFGDEVRDTFGVRDERGRKIVDAEKLRRLRVACALIKQFTYLLPLSADPAQALRQFKDLVMRVAAHPRWTDDFEALQSRKVMHTFAELMGVSRFLWEDFLRLQHENLFPLVSSPGDLEARRSREDLEGALGRELADAPGEEERAAALNRFKDREMFRIDLRHITRRIGDIPFSRELSDLTDVVVSRGTDLCRSLLAARYGEPRLEGGGPCGWSVAALGKHGGREMGFASDIELLFAYEGPGRTDGAESIENSFYFEELARLFLRHIKARQEGIFHIDLRLRPYGEKGTLACSLDAFRAYYSPQGPARQFERMALVKLRPVAGMQALGRAMEKARDDFVYSGLPLDYDNILHLRARQVEELVKPGSVNAKYGPGGLVDLEYFIQARQIERGFADPAVRVTNMMEALTRLEGSGAVPSEKAAAIRRAYRCLRRVIDGLRAVRGNAKDLAVPEPESPAFRYLARRMGYEAVEGLREELQESMKTGRSCWEEAGK